jgi:flavorubredoxin
MTSTVSGKINESTSDQLLRPIAIADGVYWVGFYDTQGKMNCNPYLIVDGSEAVLIDAGSRPDFPEVMLKILQTGILPEQIGALIFQHYDPDLCGSIPNFEDIIHRTDLKMITTKSNAMFISHYGVASEIRYTHSMNNSFRFSSGRELQFIDTPYCHSQGSFITYDTKSKVLFTSDLFGGYETKGDLFFTIEDQCKLCIGCGQCAVCQKNCKVHAFVDFHQKIFPSREILHHGLAKIQSVPFSQIAPQHGSVVRDRKTADLLLQVLYNIPEIGIDLILKQEKTGG